MPLSLPANRCTGHVILGLDRLTRHAAQMDREPELKIIRRAFAKQVMGRSKAAVRPAVVDCRWRRRPRRVACRPDGDLLLSPNEGSRKAGAYGLGPDTRCAGMHPASMHVPGPLSGAASPWRRGFRPEHANHRLSGRNVRSAASTLCRVERPRHALHRRTAPADLRGRWDAIDQAADDHRRGVEDRRGSLSDLTPRGECLRRDRLAQSEPDLTGHATTGSSCPYRRDGGPPSQMLLRIATARRHVPFEYLGMFHAVLTSARS